MAQFFFKGKAPGGAFRIALAAGAAAALCLLAGCSIDPAITLIKITPEEVTVERGATQEFTLEVEGEGDVDLGVTWSIAESGVKAGTAVTEGSLTIAEDETLTALTVKVTSTWDPSKYATAKVTVK